MRRMIGAEYKMKVAFEKNTLWVRVEDEELSN